MDQSGVAQGRRGRRHWATRLFRAGLISILPVAFSLLLLRWWLDASLFDYLPVRSDEGWQWHQATSFARVGWAHGYYTYQEVAPAAGVAGTAGPVFAAAMGTIMKITGLTGRLAAIPVIMIGAFVSLTTAGLVIARRETSTLLRAGVLLVTFGPLILYLGSGMQEPFHLGLGVLLAALFHRQIDEPNPRLTALTVVAIVSGSLLRPFWAPLLLPALLVHWRESTRKRASAFAASLGAATLLGAGFAAWSARIPYGSTYEITQAPLRDVAGLVFTNLGRNFESLLSINGVVFKTTIWQHFAFLLIAVGLTVVLVDTRLRKQDRFAALVGWLAIVPSFTLVMLLGEIDTGTRVLGAHLLLVAMLALFRGGRWVVIPLLIVGINLATWSWFQQDFESRTAVNYGADEAVITQMRQALTPHLRYDSGADPWCNTVLLSTGHGFFQELVDIEFFYELSAIEPGIGVSVDLTHEFEGDRIRSRYVLTTESVLPLLPSEALVKIGETPLRGALYQNLDAGCPRS